MLGCVGLVDGSDNDWPVIKSAYRAEIAKWHPDKHNNSPESTAKSEKIAAAYALLKERFGK